MIYRVVGAGEGREREMKKSDEYVDFEQLTLNNYVLQVELRVSAHVMGVMEVDDLRQTLQSGLFLEFYWNDPSLVWDRSNFSLSYIKVKTDFFSSNSASYLKFII
jgi:hypothetical protein